MSREVIDELIDMIVESEQKNFPEILESVVEYGFADENVLCDLFDIDDSELDELLSSSESLSNKEWKTYARKLQTFLKNARKSYERLYFADKPSLKNR